MSTNEKARGKCPECQRQIILLKSGRIRQHGSKRVGIWPPVDCAGTGARPATPGESR